MRHENFLRAVIVLARNFTMLAKYFLEFLTAPVDKDVSGLDAASAAEGLRQRIEVGNRVECPPIHSRNPTLEPELLPDLL